MEILNASDAEREFEDILLKAKKEPIAVMLFASEYERLRGLKASPYTQLLI